MDKSTHHQFPLFSNIYHKEIHQYYKLNKDLEIHLPQLINDSLQDLNLPFSLSFQINAIYSST